MKNKKIKVENYQTNDTYEFSLNWLIDQFKEKEIEGDPRQYNIVLARNYLGNIFIPAVTRRGGTLDDILNAAECTTVPDYDPTSSYWDGPDMIDPSGNEFYYIDCVTVPDDVWDEQKNY